MKGGKRKSDTSTEQTPAPPPETTPISGSGSGVTASGDELDQTQENGGENQEKPKLADGYYEIEDVRSKRVRKGQVQYLVKWRGWPETENTWEPLKNLLSCSDFIDAYEESLPGGKPRSKGKRKRKHVGTNSQPKKKQQLQSPPPVQANDMNLGELSNQINGDSLRCVLSEQEDKNGLVNEDNVINGIVSGQPPTERNDLPNKPGRCTGAKRRKSGSVKRFNQEFVKDQTDLQIGDIDLRSSDLVTDDSKSSATITEIIKPIGVSSSSLSSDNGEIFITFVAKRSDGKEVTVDNRTLRANYPLLLIEYYERNIRYVSKGP